MPPTFPFRVMAVAAVAMLLVPAEAGACLPRPLPERKPGETDEAYGARTSFANLQVQRQESDRTHAERIFIAKVVDRRQTGTGNRPSFGREGMAILKPIAWLKGTPTRQKFSLRTFQCGVGADVEYARVGDYQVVFAAAGKLGDATVIDTIDVNRITDPQLTAFAAKYRKADAAKSKAD